MFGATAARRKNRFLWAAKALVQLLKHDAVYRADLVNEALQNALGSEARLFHYPSAGISRSKYAVTTVEVEDVATEVFANYNIHDDSNVYEYPLAAYRTYQRHESGDEPLLWQV